MSRAPNAAQRLERGLPRLCRELEGREVVLTRDITTGRMVIPAGSIARISYAVGWTRITIVNDACACCGVQIIVARLSWSDLRVKS